MTPPDPHFVMGFLGGMAIGLVLGATFGLFILTLRLDPHAQYEIRVYAEAMLALIRARVPVAADAFADRAA